MKSSEVRRVHYGSAITVIVLVLAAILFGWWIGHHNSQKTANNYGSNTSTTNNAQSSSVKSLVSYTLPDGWQETACSSSSDTVYIESGSSTAGCSAPVKILVDAQNTTDCQQLKPASTEGVKKHTCSSLYINGKKSLKSLTDINGNSTADYFVNTGKGVVKAEYTYSSNNGLQAGFDQLAMSIKAN
jgi:hypothetical protein